MLCAKIDNGETQNLGRGSSMNPQIGNTQKKLKNNSFKKISSILAKMRE